MPKIVLENITKRWGKFYGVDNLNLVIEDNSFVTLLGPSGCGKTTTLRQIAGLETPTSGRITIGDRVVFDSEKGINIPANKRKVGFLFQNYALWPNMTVYQNISFGLTNVKEEMDKIDFDARVNARLAEVLSNPSAVKKVIADSVDKKGKVDEKRALLNLIDSFTLSMMSAKRLLQMDLDNAEKYRQECEAVVEQAKKDAESKGFKLDDAFRFTKDGKVVREERKLSKEEIDLSVRRVSRLVKIGPFMDRYPAELSGGQQQRVAIARTLAPEPSVLFMDEPLSNLDAKLRLEMRYELQRLHVETGSTFVYVTHDQMEAMTLATQICLINNGLLQQYDAPLTVYDKPNNLFVADFVGNPSINFAEASGSQKGDGIEITLFDKKAIFKPVNKLDLDAWFKNRDEEKKKAEELEEEKRQQKGYVEKSNKDEIFKYHIAKINENEIEKEYTPVNGDFVLGIRPDLINIDENGKLDGEIYGSMPTGMESTIKVRVNDLLLTGVIFGNLSLKIGSKVKLSVDSDRIMLFDRVSGKLITTGSVEFV
ncbi:MAG: ATP-binding cassette domain-containing protein [Spirochaetales bacterium]|nr:ATP-binding cassette domain-containing protein [Spirochaetales bacterium]